MFTCIAIQSVNIELATNLRFVTRSPRSPMSSPDNCSAANLGRMTTFVASFPRTSLSTSDFLSKTMVRYYHPHLQLRCPYPWQQTRSPLRRCRPVSASGDAATGTPESVESDPGEGSATCAGGGGSETQVRSEQKAPFDGTYSLLEGTRLVRVRRPLDVYLEETAGGEVFVDEVVKGGNAEGELLEGDVVVAVSLPYGEGLFPLPAPHGLLKMEQFVNSRGEHEAFFNLAVRSLKSIEMLREEVAEGEKSRLSRDEIREQMQNIFIDEYPIASSEGERKRSVLDLESLREAGFDV